MHYYTMSESKDIVDLTLTKDDITKAREGNDKGYPIMIESEEDNISSDSKTEIISDNLKGKLLNKAIVSYKTNVNNILNSKKLNG